MDRLFLISFQQLGKIIGRTTDESVINIIGIYCGAQIQNLDDAIENDIEEKENILSFSSEYISRNFKELYDLMLKITYDHIRIVDLNPNNLLLTEEGIIIIDYDKYRYEKELDPNILLDINKNALFYALEKKIEKGLISLNKDIDRKQIIDFISKNMTEREIKKALK